MSPNTLLLIIVFVLLIVVIIPWYMQQIGRFFCKGIIEYFEESLNKLKNIKTLKGVLNGKEKK